MNPRAREVLAELAEPLLDALRRAPDPDAALVGFSRYMATRYPKAMFLRYLIDDPRALGLLIEVLGTSPFLSEILIRNPEYVHWLVSQVDRSPPDATDLLEESDELIDGYRTKRAISMPSSDSNAGSSCALRRATFSDAKRSSRPPSSSPTWQTS